jgi:phospholipase C
MIRRACLGFAIAALFAACGDDSSAGDSLLSAREACSFDAGALPADTLGKNIPRGDEIPIDHFVLLMQENRSFDHYFGRLPAAGHSDVDGLPDDAGNPNADGNSVPAFHAGEYCIRDVEHSWNDSHRQYNDGRNDGFVTTNDPDGERAMGYLDEIDLPFYYGLAKTFAIADHMFCSVLGPTFPNRLYFLAATSDGRIRNEIALLERTSIFDRLDAAGVSWKVYAPGLAASLLVGRPPHPLEEFFADAAAGSLPQVAYVDPSFGFTEVEQNDEHAPTNPQLGQRFVESIYDALRTSPNWPRSAMVLTYDEHGGFYDHVPPPRACIPDNVPPETEPNDVQASFDRYGFRVPLLVASPYARPGHVSHLTYDLTSVLRLLEARWNLPALTARDANATPITDLFDFSRPRLLDPPPLPKATLDPVQAQLCAAFAE